MTPLPVVDTRHLFGRLAEELVELLESIPDEAWYRPTCYPNWRVRDIVSHLVQTATSRLSSQRDAGRVRDARRTEPSFEEICRAIDRSNDAWAGATSSLSPVVLLDLVRLFERQLATLLADTDADADATAVFAVGWAGESESLMWFDVAREFTERWHHQQQIREAVGAKSIAREEYLGPAIRTFVRCLPHWFRGFEAEPETEIRIAITGDSGGAWTLSKGDDRWLLGEDSSGTPRSIITISEDIAWRHWTRSVSASRTRPSVRIEGDTACEAPFMASRAIMIAEP